VGCREFHLSFLFAFAIKNTDPVSVRFFLDTAWQAPLIIVVLAFFAGGAALGAIVPAWDPFRPAPEISRLKRSELQCGHKQ
jgi:putative membrane protein